MSELVGWLVGWLVDWLVKLVKYYTRIGCDSLEAEKYEDEGM